MLIDYLSNLINFIRFRSEPYIFWQNEVTVDFRKKLSNKILRSKQPLLFLRMVPVDDLSNNRAGIAISPIVDK